MTEVLLYVLGVLIMLLGLAVSIGLHEIGHLLPAKLFGVKVTQYMVGFGRTLWSRRRGETEYGVKLIPLGGYVSMIGMYPPQRPGEAARESTTGFLNSVVEEGASRRGQPEVVAEIERIGDPEGAPEAGARRGGVAGLVDEARLASAETIEAGEDHRAFYRLAVWKKIVVMLGGPLMNLVLAFVFLAIALVGVGLPQSSMTLSAVSQCLVPASSTGTDCGPDDPAAPGAAAGLEPGDRIVSVDGQPIEGWSRFRAIVGESPGVPLALVFERDGTERATTLTPLANERVVVDAEGRAVLGDDGEPLTEVVGMIGATPGTEYVSRPVAEVPAYVGESIQAMGRVIIGLPQRMVDVWNAAFGAEERDPGGPMSVVGVGRLTGEIVSMDEVPLASRAQMVFSVLGSLNIALFLFNLVPLMPLDGGHIAGAIYEGIKRGWARLRGKPDPGPVDTARMVPITMGVVVVFGAMMLLLVYADIVKPVSLFG